MMFKTVGRNPLVGIIASFVAVFAGFSANVFIAGTDLLISGISTEVVQSVRPDHEVSVLANWFFMCVSVPLITCIITVITHKYAEPALQRFSHSGEDAAEPVTAELSDTEQRALRRTGIVALLFIYSGSAQWALMAPVFLPMLMGLEPEAVQAAYRIADSSTNVISPITPYLPLILAFIHSYSPRFTIGNLLATALPYSLAILSGWIVLFFVWYALGLPFGIY
ncbi:hypothetical protein C9J03_03535 [Photobacterium gaetbulicola]|uniref:Aminobenzoyl-glutamate transport protein n=1 Tax=Photobacterium gaetbulicola Gung47 TaxID=658445 RepID=A0A0C5WUE3_9GAMM|nr:AbgT family transporter [Photobacterium gaetbulicola]AJR06670.1 hypothetical protein H744_1c1652 [Photobacterium gaetbulicola Gung47]PSU13990.1 hypothetical protein C9J03_03535 [Photobacterium gaetbulicola]